MRRGLGVFLAAVVGVVLVPSTAAAAPPAPSDVVVSDTALVPGETFTVDVELYNPEAFTVQSAAASLRLVEAPVTDVLDLVSCTGSTVACFAFSPTSYRGPVGDLAPQATVVVSFTFRVRDDAAGGAFTLEHQLLGANFAFAAVNGPQLTVTPAAADIAVGLAASPRGVLTSRITYTVAVTNLGPGDATGVQVSGSYPLGLAWGGGNGCVRVGSHGVRCDLGNLPAGTSTTASFAVSAGLLTLGSFATSVTRAESSPADPNSGNDTARRSCAALTGLLVRC